MTRLDPTVVRRLRPVAVAVLVAPLAVVFWRGSTPIHDHVEYAGLIPKIEQLAAHVGPRDLLLVESRNAGSDLHVIATPLAYVYGKQVLVLDSIVPPKKPLEAFLRWAWQRYDRVLFLAGGGTDLLTRTFAAEPLLSERFYVPEYDHALNAYPSGVKRKDFEFGLYRLVPAVPRPPGPLRVRIGVLDDLNILRFHARELHGDTGEYFRWTGPQSFVLLLGAPPGATSVVVWMSRGGRPPGAAPPVTEFALDDRVLGIATPDDEVRPYRFSLPPELAARLASAPEAVRLRLRVPTWNPAATIGGSDTRDLGVIVTEVDVE